MKKVLLLALSTACFALLLPLFVSAQDDKTISAAGSMYLISAKAGGVNLVEGTVTVARSSGTSGRLLNRDNVEVGDKVSTGADGKVELLLNPGSFVRLGSNSTFEFVSTSLDDVEIKLGAGSAMLEVYADNEFVVTVALPKSKLELTKTGVYRVDVASDGNAFLSVYKGRAYLGATELKEGRMASISESNPSVLKFDRDNGDDLVVWSKLRAKEAVKVNQKLQRKQVLSSMVNSFNNGIWNSGLSLGVWAFDARLGRWCYIPFGFGWYSPYGFYYNTDAWSLGVPYWALVGGGRQTWGGGGVGNGGGGTGGGNGGGTGSGNSTIRTDRKKNPNDDNGGVRVNNEERGGRPRWQQFEINQGIGNGGRRLDPGGIDTPMGGGGGFPGGGATRGGGDTKSSEPVRTVDPTPPIRVDPSTRKSDPKDN